LNNVLPDLVLRRRQHQVWSHSGIDSPEHCVDLDHFRAYPWPIEYRYNSRGFRDQEWPNTAQELQSAVWCLGDSFTVGIGVPVEHTWAQCLERQLAQRCINISLDGASNDWIARRGSEILSVIQPRSMVVHWSYVERRELDTVQADEERRHQSVYYTERENVENLRSNIAKIEAAAGSTQIIHSVIPGFSQYPATQKMIFDHLVPPSRLVEYFTVQDWARDHHHYDIKTANTFATKILELLTL